MYFRFEAGLHVSQTHCILEDHLYISLFSLVHQQEVRIQLEEAGNLFALTWNEKKTIFLFKLPFGLMMH